MTQHDMHESHGAQDACRTQGAHEAQGASAASGGLARLAQGGRLAVVGDAAGQGLGMPFQQQILLIPDIRVAGTTHVDGIERLAGELTEGSRLEFRREPQNPHDRWAIRVHAPSGGKLGYVPCDCNEIPARLMDAGKLLFGKVTSVEDRNGWHRIGMEVYLDD